MAAKMRSSSIEPKPADEDAETAGLDLMSLLVNPVARGVLRRRVDGVDRGRAVDTPTNA